MYKILNDKKVCPDETACRPKPWLGSALSMVPVLVGEANRWKWENGADLLKPDENIHILVRALARGARACTAVAHTAPPARLDDACACFVLYGSSREPTRPQSHLRHT